MHDDSGSTSAQTRLPEIIRAVAVANRSLAPPLRIPWSRVLSLNGGQQIPLTKKGAIFRKKLEELFGEKIRRLLSRPDDLPLQAEATPTGTAAPSPSKRASEKSKDQITTIVANVVTDALGICTETLENNPLATFAEVRCPR